MSSILIAEDSCDLADILKAILSSQGHDISGVASTGEEVLEMARKVTPDLVLMDIRLNGDMDGIVAAEYLQKDANVPVIFLTGAADKETKEKAMRMHPSDYITKPFSCRYLLAAIDRALPKR